MAKNNVSNLPGSDDQPDSKSPKDWHQFWQKELDAAKKRTRQYSKWGNQIIARFLDERQDGGNTPNSTAYRGNNSSRLNLFYVNITTQQKMLFGSTPKIDVSREHADPDDDLARVAATLYERILQADANIDGDDLGIALRQALQDRLLPGMGTARVYYDVKYKKAPQMNPETMDVEDVEVIDEESCDVKYVHWQDYLWGWSRSWVEVPWQAYRSFLTRQEASDRFGPKIANNLAYKEQVPTGKPDDEIFNADQKSNVHKAEIWEIWQKKTKQVFWWSQGADLILDIEDDPLQLDGFWPGPRPMIANPTTTLFMPRADFILAQDLYNEIDILQSRITTITDAVKMVGVYDKSEVDSVGRMFKEGVENDMIPVDNWALFAEKGGLEGAVDWYPVETATNVLQTLITIRDQTIELLYQITGMSDILRGANTDQYTSDGTNQLKAKFGSIRVQALQDEFAQFASDLDGLKAEVISKHFDPKTIFVQSNAEFMPQADQDKIVPAIQLMQSPAIKWRVKIKPESLAMVDYAQLKAERTEYLTATATFLQSAMTMVKDIPESLPVLLEMLKWGMAGFKGADYLEGTLDSAIEMAKNAPPPKEDDGQKEAAAQQAEMQKIQAKLAADMQVIQAKGQQEIQKIQMDNQANMAEIQAKAQADLQKIAADLRADMQVIAEKLGADIKVEKAQSAFAIAEQEVEHGNTMVEEQQQHSDTLAEQRAKPTTGGSNGPEKES